MPREVHLHGVTAEDVAAILAERNRMTARASDNYLARGLSLPPLYGPGPSPA